MHMPIILCLALNIKVKKDIGYFCNSSYGRDWGNQHVNDVRRLVGGIVF